MSTIPADLKYAKTHEWVQTNEPDAAKVGISDHAQGQLGDVVYVELPEVGRKVRAGEACAVVESVKAASDIYSPVTGEIVAVNGALSDAPEQINQDAYGAWLFSVKCTDAAELDALLDAAAYQGLTEGAA
jgi:glycine cleavage system H protein